MLTHVVLIKLHDRSPEAIDRVKGVLDSLAGNVPTLRAIEVGRDVVRAARSYDLALIARFDDLAGLEAYQSHQAHLPVLTTIREAAESVVAVDFES